MRARGWWLGMLAGGLLLAGGPAYAQSSPTTQCVTTAQAGGTGDALTIPLLPCTGTTTMLVLSLTATNTTTSPTLQETGYSALPVLNANGAGPAVGELSSGTTLLLTNTGTSWKLLSSALLGIGLPANGVNNEIFYQSSGALAQIPGANSSILATNGSGVPSLVTTLPSGLSIPGAALTGGTINGTSVGLTTPSTGAFTTLTVPKNNAMNAVTLTTPDDTSVNWDTTPLAAISVLAPPTPTTRHFLSGIWVVTNGATTDNGRGIGIQNIGASDGLYVQTDGVGGTGIVSYLTANATTGTGEVISTTEPGQLGLNIRQETSILSNASGTLLQLDANGAVGEMMRMNSTLASQVGIIFRMTGANADPIVVKNAGGNTIAQLDGAGNAFFTTLNVAGGTVFVGSNNITPQTFSNILTGNDASTSPYPGGPLGSNVWGIQQGTLNVWNNFLYGWGGSATGLCVETGNAQPALFNCQVEGGDANPWGPAFAPGGDKDAALIQIDSWANTFGGALGGTFTATTFAPTVALNGSQVAELRVGMRIKTNDATPYWGLVTGWASNGTSVSVSEWCHENPGVNACTTGTPAGTTAIIDYQQKIFGLNVVSNRNAGAQQTENTNQEFDCNNNSGVDDTGFDDSVNPYDGCVDAVNLGSNRSAYGLLTRGKFVSQFTVEGDSTYGVHIHPATGNSVGIGLSLQDNIGGGMPEAFRVWTNSGTIESQIFTNGNAFFNGTVQIGGFTVAALPTAGTAGRLAYVTDQLTACPALNGTFTGGGSVKCLAFDNGTSWIYP